MLDTSVGYDIASMVEAAEDSQELRELCREYFEIAIGVRRPTEDETNTVSELLVKRVLGEIELNPERLIHLSKRPLDFELMERTHYQNEYVIFSMIAASTEIIDSPSIPMFRYELATQRVLSQEDEYDVAILRQSAFFETYFKMKIGRWKDQHGNHLGWDRCLDCAHKGEHLITEKEVEDLYSVYTSRNGFAHDFRSYIARESDEKLEMQDVFTTGLTVMAALYHNELERAYTDYTDEIISKRLATNWRELDKTSIMSSEARISEYEIECENCGREFSVFTEGHKRCPYCDAPHDAISSFTG